jgi:hypothetical protein
MNFLEEIKSSLTNDEKRRGLRQQVTVNSRALLELIQDYERLDSYMRCVYEDKDNFVPLETRLHNVVTAMYHGRSSEDSLLLFVVNVLAPLIKETIKLKYFENLFS